MDTSSQQIIEQTKNWINEIVIGLDLCPFASKVMLDDVIDYIVVDSEDSEQHLHALANCFTQLNQNTNIETSLLIFPNSYLQFDDYLDLLALANLLLEDLMYEGTYQVASFHPDYRFNGTTEDDASNFSNRSPYPMLHILREASVEKAIEHYEDIDDVPEINIQKLKKIGFESMQLSLQNILKAKL